jgi:hypothetical protein
VEDGSDHEHEHSPEHLTTAPVPVGSWGHGNAGDDPVEQSVVSVPGKQYSGSSQTLSRAYLHVLPKDPMLHVQAVAEVLLNGEWELEGQSVHCPMLVVHKVDEQYFPAAHPTTFHLPLNPDSQRLPKLPSLTVKTTCRNGWLVDDVYVLALTGLSTGLPDSVASFSLLLHSDDVHRLMSKKS